jgi:hypothetical protein
MPSAGAITCGQTLAASTLTGGAATNGTSGAAVAGTFDFASPTLTPEAGTTNVWVVFTPADTDNYTTASGQIAVAVNKDAPELTMPSAGAITCGQTLDSSPLTGGAATNGYSGAAVAGTFDFVSPRRLVGPTPERERMGGVSQPCEIRTTIHDHSQNLVAVGKDTPALTMPSASAILCGRRWPLVLTVARDERLKRWRCRDLAFAVPDAKPPNTRTKRGFTPTDTLDYTCVTGSVSVTVHPA